MSAAHAANAAPPKRTSSSLNLLELARQNASMKAPHSRSLTIVIKLGSQPVVVVVSRKC